MKVKSILFVFFFLLSVVPASASWSSADSLRIVTLLHEAVAQKEKPHSWMLWFGRKFVGTPYVGGTLDRGSREELVVNTRQMDCTTFVETVAALTLCAQRHQTSFADFCSHLLCVRYMGGAVEYTARKHYFTLWIDDNVQHGIVRDIHPVPPFTVRQTVEVNWMSTHVANYKMLKAHPEWREGIRQMENRVSGKQYLYIPKGEVKDNDLFRSTIHDGDIIAIVTRKKGLDTTHIGIAVWHEDGLHLLNASSIYHKVVEDSQLLAAYMRKQPSQTGIRVCRIVGEN